MSISELNNGRIVLAKMIASHKATFAMTMLVFIEAIPYKNPIYMKNTLRIGCVHTWVSELCCSRPCTGNSAPLPLVPQALLVVLAMLVVLLVVLVVLVALGLALNVLWGRSVLAIVLVERGGVRGALAAFEAVFAVVLALLVLLLLKVFAVVVEGVRALALLARA